MHSWTYLHISSPPTPCLPTISETSKGSHGAVLTFGQQLGLIGMHTKTGHARFPDIGGVGGFMSVPNILLLLPRFEIHCKTIVGRDEPDSGCNVQLDCADTDGVENITTRRRSVEELLHILKNDVTRVITFSNAEMEVSVTIMLNIRWKHFLLDGGQAGV